MRGAGSVRVLWTMDIKGQRERKGKESGIQKSGGLGGGQVGGGTEGAQLGKL